MSPSNQHRRPPARPAGVLLLGGKATLGRPRCSSLWTFTTFLIALALAVACDAGGEDSTKSSGESAEEDTQESNAIQETVVKDGAAPDNGEDAFVASGEGSGGETGAADRIESTRFRIFTGYERLLIDFGAGGGEAGVPRWTLESPEEGGYVRLRFLGVSSTQVAHEDFIGSVLTDMYVVRDHGGGLFADVFAAHGFRYRVTEMPEAGRLAVDFRGVSDELRFPPTTGDKAVVLQPREAEEVGSPIEVRGYARPFEGQVTASLLDRERDVLASKTVRTKDWTSAWGRFGTTLEFLGYEGLATLRVGSRSPRDGSFVGTETEVFLESSGPG